ncbi:hypothetical protein Taro_052972 [Colocasia esculenta]|uniref:Uncharacterized protein n=1 Tax=Colocasia esculenta TaxID=4460 RepID=A0A843XJP6_COLES|nr:hypothetical protein [Colocasia esculenta]
MERRPGDVGGRARRGEIDGQGSREHDGGRTAAMRSGQAFGGLQLHGAGER